MGSTKVQFQVRRSRTAWQNGDDEDSPRVGECFPIVDREIPGKRLADVVFKITVR